MGRRRTKRTVSVVAAFALASGVAAPLWAQTTASPAPATPAGASDPVAAALRTLLSNPTADPALDRLYAARADRPLWIEAAAPTAEAAQTVSLIAAASQDGLNAAAYHPDTLARDLVAARAGDPQALARFELELTAALGDYAADLHSARGAATPIFTDPDLQPPADARLAAWQAAAAAQPGARLFAATRMSPLYVALRKAYAAAPPGSPAAQLARLNMERVRALPADLGPKFLFVDLATQRLWMYEAGQPPQSMKVVVGKRTEPTPTMVGLMRDAVFRPYWNVPPDLAQARARKVLTSGLSHLEHENIEALSDWSDQAHVVPLEQVDWRAAADGERPLRVRQRPGPGNMMGQVKFTFPNAEGIYLHDTPLRWPFQAPQRTASAGCIRLEDAPRLARWLLGPQAADAELAAKAGPPEDQVALPRPTPIYILYLTDAPAADPLAEGPLLRRPDVYHRDQPTPAPARPPAAAPRLQVSGNEAGSPG